jgi:Protein of unknown function (DUF3237)
MAELATEFLFELRIPHIAADVVNMGKTPASQLMYAVAASGSFKGPKLSGEVIPNSGGDWTRVRNDNSIVVDVRICLRTSDGVNILMTYGGVMWAATTDDIYYMIDATKPDDPAGASRYYYRTTCQFETGDLRYGWLNHTLAVGNGRLGDNQVIYQVYAIK